MFKLAIEMLDSEISITMLFIQIAKIYCGFTIVGINLESFLIESFRLIKVTFAGINHRHVVFGLCIRRVQLQNILERTERLIYVSGFLEGYTVIIETLYPVWLGL